MLDVLHTGDSLGVRGTLRRSRGVIPREVNYLVQEHTVLETFQSEHSMDQGVFFGMTESHETFLGSNNSYHLSVLSKFQAQC